MKIHLLEFKSIVFIILLILGFNSLSFSQTLEELRLSYSTSSDTNRSIIAGEIAWQSLLQNQLDSSLKYAFKELSDAKLIGWDKGIAQGYNDIGIVKYYQSEYQNALRFYDSSLSIRLLINDQHGIAAIYNKQGLIYQDQARFEAFIETQQSAYEIFENLKDTMNMAKSLNNLADGYQQIRAHNKAIELHLEALKLREAIADSFGMAATYLNLGNCYLNDSTSFMYFKLSLNIFEVLNEFDNIAIVYHNLAITCKQIGLDTEAEDYISKAISLKEKIGNKAAMADSYMAAADIYRQLGKLELCRKYLDLGEKLSLELGVLNNMEFIYSYKASYFADLGILDSAYYYQTQCTNLKNELFSDRLFENVATMRTRYETERKESENLLLKQTNKLKEAELKSERAEKRQLLFSAILLLIIALLVFGLIFYQRKLRTKQRIADLEKQKYASIIEAEENERGRIAKELHDGLGQLLSSAKLNVAAVEESTPKEDLHLVKTSMDLIDEAVSEVRSISHNLMPIALSKQGLKAALEDLSEKINHSQLLRIILEIDELGDLISKSTEVTIYRVTQEILNNALKHANASEIHISIIKHKNSILLSISDNGIGFDIDKINSDKGIGWSNIFSRISLINGKIKIDSNKNSGTHLSINIPIS